MDWVTNGLSDLVSRQEQFLPVLAFSLALLLLWRSSFGKRLGTVVSDVMFTNWQLGLLALTGIVLSIASGWTTWDGMSNFTKEPLLSALVTFGIQGVMLIVAWLIGESFATGMNHRPKGRGSKHLPGPVSAVLPWASALLGILLIAATIMLIVSRFWTPDAVDSARYADAYWWINWWDKLILAAPVVLLVTLLIVNAGSDILEDYMQSLRVMIRSAVLWVMFLACMATSVFFSFDSLFSTIFPASERQRAADLRAQNQVAGIVNDIGSLVATRRLTEQEALFRNADWARYSGDLDQLEAVANGAQDKLQAYLERKLQERQNELNRFQEEKSSAQSQQASLTQRKAFLNTEIARFKEQVSGLAPEVARLKSAVFAKDRELIEKNAEAEAEAGGIGITEKVGRGRKYREIKSQFDRLSEEKKNLELQLREFEKRLDTARQGVTQSETELTRTDGEIAQLKSRSDTADRRIIARQKRAAEAPNFDTNSGLQQLAKARKAFRREPTSKGLANIQDMCGNIVAAMQGQEVLKNQTTGISCDPGPASEAAARLFALNSGLIALQTNCVGGGKMPVSGGADALFSFARRCVQDAGLPSQDTENLRQQINYVELNRDDKAHRFVVTTNAFGDGNKLAYLALAIAIAIDALVFMSGLFGANAVRSPLSDMHGGRGLSADQLENIIDGALKKTPDPVATIRAITNHSQALRKSFDGFSSRIRPSSIEDDTLHRPVLTVLNAAATIDAVEAQNSTEIAKTPFDVDYLLRKGFIKYLSAAATKSWNVTNTIQTTTTEELLLNAARPEVVQNVELFLRYCRTEGTNIDGFVSSLELRNVEEQDEPAVTRILQAAASRDLVKKIGPAQFETRSVLRRSSKKTGSSASGQLWIHADLIDALMSLRNTTEQTAALVPSEGTLSDHQSLLAKAPSGADALASNRGSVVSGYQDDPGSHATIEIRHRQSDSPQFDRSDFISRLLEPMGIDRDEADARIRYEDVGKVHLNAWNALNALADSDDNLQKEIGDFWNIKGEEIDRNSSTLRLEIGGDETRLELLKEAKELVDQQFGSLLMLPESGFMDSLVQGYKPIDDPSDIVQKISVLRDVLRGDLHSDTAHAQRVIDELGSVSKVARLPITTAAEG